MQPSKGIVIGLTGTIGSGKSTVSAYLKKKGAFIVDADAISRCALEKGGAGYRMCLDTFGDGILLPNGTIDRKKLAAVVFSSEEARGKLNAIVHPLVLAEMQRMTQEAFLQGEKAVIWDVPLLFESGMQAFCQETWLVYCTEETSIRRLLARDGMTREEALRRIRSQMDTEKKKELADRLLPNDGSLRQLYIRCTRLWNQVLARTGKSD